MLTRKAAESGARTRRTHVLVIGLAVTLALGCAEPTATLTDASDDALRASPTPAPTFPLTFSVQDPLGDHTGPVDLVGMTMSFDNTTGEYEIVLTAAAASAFVGAFRINIGLFNPDVGTTNPNPSFFSDVVNDYDLSVPTTTITLTGTSTNLTAWTAGQRVFTNSLAGTGNPDGISLFRSGVGGFPLGFLTNEDVIAFGDLTQPAIIESTGPRGGAIVLNSGEGKPDLSCSFGGFTTNEGTAVHAPQGNGHLICDFEGLPPIPAVERLEGFQCRMSLGGVSTTFQSKWVRTPSGDGRLTCQFLGKPEFDAMVKVDGVAYPAQQGAITIPLDEFVGGRLTAEVVHVGRACGGDQLLADPQGKIALIERGVCTFTEKLSRALGAGAIGAIVYNSAAGGDALLTMGGTAVGIPGVFVGRSTGLELIAVAPVEVTIAGCGRSMSCKGAP